MPISSIDQDSESIYNRAIQALNDGNIAEAQRLIDLPAVVSCTENHIQRERAKILALFGKTTEAIELINKALITEPQNWFSLIYRACFFASMDKKEEAAKDISAARLNYLHGDFIIALREQAESSYKSGEYTSAYFFYYVLLLLKDEEEDIPNEMVLSLMAMRLYDLAKQNILVKILLERKHNSGWFHYEDFFALAEIELSTVKYSDALRSIETIESYFRFESDVTPEIHIDEENNATDEEIKEHSEMMIAMWRELQYLRGLCEFNLGKYLESAGHLANALSGERSLGHELFGMDGKAYRVMQSKRSDVDAIERLRTDALLRSGKISDTIQSLSNILEKNPTDSEALYQRGVAYIQMDEYGKAIKDFLKAKSLGYLKAQSEIDNISGINNTVNIEEVIDSDHPNVFQRNGEMWFLRYNGEDTFTLKEYVGLRYIQMLLMNKNTIFHPRKMIASLHKETEIEKSNDESQGESFHEPQKYIDPKAKENYKKRIIKLQAQRSEIEEKPGSPGHDIMIEEVDNEIEELKKQIMAGEYRMINPDDKKNENAVKNAMDRAIEKIRKHDTALADHLKDSIDTGLKIFYHPTEQISWLV